MNVPNIAKAIRSAREAKEMTLGEASARLNVTPQYWCQVEREAKFPSLDQLIRMARVVGLTVKVSIE